MCSVQKPSEGIRDESDSSVAHLKIPVNVKRRKKGLKSNNNTSGKIHKSVNVQS